MSFKLNPEMETMLLILNTPWDDEAKAETIETLNNMGADGAAFYKRNCQLIEKYFSAFLEKRVESPGTRLIGEAEIFSISVYMDIILRHSQWVYSLGEVAEEEVKSTVKERIISALEGQEDIITGLDVLRIPDKSKWQIMMLLQKPVEQLGMIFKAVRDNIAAFEFACSQIEDELQSLLVNFETLSKSDFKIKPLKIAREVDSNAVLVPSLAVAFSVVIMDELCVCGLLCDRLFQSAEGEIGRDELSICAKSLSDKSKLEILLCLKEQGSLYSLEIAEKVGLTPATVSHHMSILLTTGFVGLEKKGGKVFYELNPEGIRKFITSMERLLLS